MMYLLVLFFIGLGVLALAWWAVGELAPPPLQRPLQILVIVGFVLFVIYLIVRLLPMLGVS